ncbi:MAG: MarR family transcriptional regulator [Anaerolineae bacterium]|jgi:DNA-binding MarR family transcriptional regulator|nr:MarR family transcriptional regulator [Anaerolineae bacterium]
MSHIRAEDVARTSLKIFPILGRLMDVYMRLSDYDLSTVQFEVLLMLDAHALTVSELAQRHNVSAASMSKTITVMEERGWVHRERSSTDRRIVTLALTGEGKNAMLDVQRHTLEYLTRTFSHLSPEEMHVIDAGIEMLSRAFAIHETAPDSS